MINRLTDYYFWFSQPPTVLTVEDKYFGFIFIGLFVFAIIFLLTVRLAKNPVNKTLFRKLWHFAFSTSLSGIIWLGIRYENTPIFGQRYWAGLTLIMGIVWAIFILKYLLFNYHPQKLEYDKELVKKKYLPGAK